MRRALRSLSLLALIAVVGTASIALAAEFDAFDAVRAAVTGDPTTTTQPPEPAPTPPQVEPGGRQATGDGSGLESGDYVEDRILVRFERGVGTEERAESAGEVDAEQVSKIGSTTVYELTGQTDVPEAVEQLDADPAVASVEPDYVRRLDACADCWQLGPSPGVDVTSVHTAGRKGAGTVVGVIDTGVDDSLADLSGQVVAKRACTATGCIDGGTPGPHATMVGSIIAAKDDGAGITGVAPAAKLKSWKVDTGGANPGIPTSYVLAALRDATADPDLDVINMSFSGEERSVAEAEAVAGVLAAGKSVVASAGNDGSYVPRYPAGYPGVISVGAADQAGNVPSWSSFGKVDVIAPGVCVATVAPAGAGGDGGCPASQPGVIRATGTSFSSPVVAGVLALRSAGTVLRERLAVEGTALGIAGVDAAEAKRRGHGLVSASAFDASFAATALPYLVAEATEQLANPTTTFKVYSLTSNGLLTLPPALATFTGAATGTAPFSLVEAGVFAATAQSGSLSPGSHVLSASAEPATLVTDDAPTTTTGAPPAETTTTTTTLPETTTTTTTTEPPAEPATSAPEPAAEPAAAVQTTAPPAEPDQAPASAEAGAQPDAAATTTAGAGVVGGATRGLDAVQALLTTAVPVRALRADDQAPGVAFFTDGADSSDRTDALQGGGRGTSASTDVDDVWSVTLGKGDQIRATLRPPKGESLRMALYSPGTTDVWGQWDHIVAQPGAAAADGSLTLTYTADQDGAYLVDTYALGADSGAPAAGAYTLSVSVTPPAGQAGPVTVTAPFCSPNGDGAGEVCRWSVDDPAAKAITSTVQTKAGVKLVTTSGDGDFQWNGTDSGGNPQPDGAYVLRVLVNGLDGGSRTVTFDQTLTLDRVRPAMSDPDADPNPFEPVPRDGDRDKVTFSAVSNERALLRVYVYDSNGGRLRKTVQATGFQPAGRLTADWDGVSGDGDQLPRGWYDYLVHVIDQAGNRVGTTRITGLRIG
jgi:flagellar hook assembly protein FlgD